MKHIDHTVNSMIQCLAKQLHVCHPDFSLDECIELCQSYCEKFNTKTKSQTIMTSLAKWLHKDFNVPLPQDSPTHHTHGFRSMPSHLFGEKQKTQQGHILLEGVGLSLSLGTTQLFDNLNFRLLQGQKVSLVGKNGAGKSTLLKMIIGAQEYHHGTITCAKDARIGYLSQDLRWSSYSHSVREEMLTTFPDITHAMHRIDAIYQLLENNPPNVHTLLHEQEELMNMLVHTDGYTKYDLQTKILSAFDIADTRRDDPISSFSGGEQTKIQLAKCLIQDVDLLILDEPTNHLDIAGIMFLEEFCHRWNKALICISHDRHFLNTTFDTTRELLNGNIHVYDHNFNNYIIEKKARYERQCRLYTVQQKEKKKQEKFIERFRYKASKASQVQSRIKLMNKQDWLEEPVNDTHAGDLNIAIPNRLPALLYRTQSLSIGYHPNKPLIKLPPKLDIERGDKIGVIGANGVGKSTLLKTLLGLLPPLAGTCNQNSTIHIGYFSQILAELDPEATVAQTLHTPGHGQSQIRNMLGQIHIHGDTIHQKIHTLSGGERAKVALTKLLLNVPQMIIMDEPTNHLDIWTKQIIISMIQRFDGVTLIVSHDRDLITKTSTQLWVINDSILTPYNDVQQGFNTYLHTFM